MNTETVKIKELANDPANVRQHDERNLDAIKASLQRFGQQKPIVVDGKGIVVAGNGTLLAAKSLGWKDIEIVRTELEGANAIAYAVADNRTAELAVWDDDALARTLEALRDDDSIEQLVTGFTDQEIEDLIGKTIGLDDIEQDEIPEPPSDPITQVGDLWILGEHRLLCGDSTSEDDVERLMDGEKVSLMVTDPPYGINLDTDYSKMGATTTKYNKIKGDECKFDLGGVVSISNTKEQFIWGGDYFVESLDWMKGTQIIWAKRHSENENKVFGSAYESLWVSYKCKKAIWFIRPINQSSERLGKRPTQKPIECMTRCIKMSKLIGSIFDPFMGSGTTLIACEQLGRKCYGMR